MLPQVLDNRARRKPGDTPVGPFHGHTKSHPLTSPPSPTLTLPGTKIPAGLSKRLMRTLIAVLATLCVLGLYGSLESSTEPLIALGEATEDEEPIVPPLYEKYHARERALPQHNMSLPAPDGEHAKFFWVSNHVHASGWGNAMQELIMNAHLAHTSGRAFVFDNYTWDRDGPDFSEFNGKLIPSRIPLSAMISGPINGGDLPPDDPVPRSVSREYFDSVCPEPTIIDQAEVNWALGNAGAGAIFEQWLEKLATVEDRCVQIKRDSMQIFDIWVFGTRRILDIWPSLSKSPMLTGFRWAPLIHAAFDANKHLFQDPPSRFLSYLPFLQWFLPSPAPASSHPSTPLPGLLALHIRRGDFAEHCMHLARWNSTWNGFNAFPGLPDTFSPPPGGAWGQNTPENKALYLEHCFPSIPQIVRKVADVYLANPGLKRVYVMTNGAVAWVRELEDALRAMEVEVPGAKGVRQRVKWEGISSSRDLRMSWEQKYVAQALDMMIGQRAQVFVGNGFSSLTSNIIMLRQLYNFPLESSRFW